MNNQALPAGSRVRVISYGPFRGLKGIIRKVDTIPGLEADEAFCFYLVELEGTYVKEPIWFACDEVELVDCPSSDDEGDLVGVDVNQVPVVEDHRLVGVLSREDIMRFLEIRRGLGLDEAGK